MKQQFTHILLLGILERSGTNFLYNTLIQHSEISPMNPKGEDCLLKSVKLLDEYSHSTSAHWHTMWGGGLDINQQRQELQLALGEGLAIYLRGEDPQTEFICSKTPSTIGIDSIPAYFPKSKVILLVREPVATIASGVKSFGWTWRAGIHEWKQSAKRIIDFLKKEGSRALLVRYEDLIHHPESTLEEISAFLNINRRELSAATIRNQPVVGSSTLGNQEGKIEWGGIKADQQFDPTVTPDVPAWATDKVSKATSRYQKQLGYQEFPPPHRLSFSDYIERFFTESKELLTDNWRVFRNTYLS